MRRTKEQSRILAAQVVDLTGQGKAPREIANALGIHVSWVYRVAAAHGCARWSLRSIPVRNVVVLYTEEKWSLRRLADALKVSAGRVARTLQAHGVKLRSRNEGSTPTAKVALYVRRGLSWREVAHACGRYGKHDPETLRLQYRRAVERGEITP